MKIERDERRFDFHDIGLAIKRAREAIRMKKRRINNYEKRRININNDFFG